MKNLLSIIIFLGCWAGTCKKNPFVEKVYSIRVVNDSTADVTSLISYEYSDTSIPNDYNRMAGIRSLDFRYFDSRKPWKDVLASLPNDTLSLFFFSVDTIKRYGWEVTRDQYKILKRYDLSLKDLKQLNWTVTYPPGDSMKDVKQFPPY